MAEAEVQTRLPALHLTLSPDAPNWEEVKEDLAVLDWLNPEIETCTLLVGKAIQLLDTYATAALAGTARFNVMNLNTVKFFMNNAFSHFLSYKNEIKDACAEAKKRMLELGFFLKAKELLLAQTEDTLAEVFKAVVLRYEDMKMQAKGLFLYLKSAFQTEFSKDIEDFIDEQFFKQVLKDSKYALRQNDETEDLFLKYDRTYAPTYSTYYSNYPSYSWANSYNRDSIYFGEMNEEEQRHGYGEINYSNGDIYKGNWAADKHDGRGVYIWKDHGRYEGDFVEGKMQGNGKRVYQSGNVYVGQFVDGKKHGQGTMKYTNGDEYNGQWDDDYMHGRGTYTWAQGDSFTGKFVKDRREDKGTLTMASGEVVEAEWVNGKMRIAQV